VGDVVDFGTVARLRELVIGDHDSDDDDALPQKLLLLMKIAQPKKNENSSRHQGIALLEPQRAKSMRNLNKSALSSEQLQREQQPQIKQSVIAPSLVLASQQS
jgi:hypothetical protein